MFRTYVASSKRRLVAVDGLIAALMVGAASYAAGQSVTITLTEHGIPHVVAQEAGDVAGLALLNRPYGWIAVELKGKTFSVTRFDEQQGRQTHVTVSAPLGAERVWLRTECDLLSERQTFSFSTDGATFEPLK